VYYVSLRTKKQKLKRVSVGLKHDTNCQILLIPFFKVNILIKHFHWILNGFKHLIKDLILLFFSKLKMKYFSTNPLAQNQCI